MKGLHCAIVSLLCHAALLLAASTNTIDRDAEYNIRVWETDQGLPKNTVLALAQTSDGYLWVGTLSGLARFNGLEFTVFDTGNTPALADNRILTLFADSGGRLWIGTESGGVVVMRDGQFTAVTELPQSGTERRLVGVCEDESGAIWLLAANRDIWRYDGQRYTPFLLSPQDGAEPRSIIKEPNGPVWIATTTRQVAVGKESAGDLQLPVTNEIKPERQVDRLVPSRQAGYWRLADRKIQLWTRDRMEREYGPYPWPDLIAAGRVAVTAASEDREGNLVVGTQGAGMFIVDRDSGAVTALSTNHGLSHTYVLALLTDREGTLWAGTDSGGLNRIKPQAFHTLRPTHGWVVQSVAEDKERRIWLGTYGQGIATWSPQQFERLGINQGVPPFVRTVFFDRENQLWAGTPRSGLLLFQERGPVAMAAPHVHAIHQDRSGGLWFGSEHGLTRLAKGAATQFTASNGLPADAVTAINEDQAGNLWIGTRRNGLYRLEGANCAPVTAPAKDIAAIYFDESGTGWITTIANGLMRFRDGKWTRYGKKAGLVNESLGYIVDSGDGELWLGSSAGVLRLLKHELDELAAGKRSVVGCRAYGKADGLPNAECTSGSQPGGMRDSQGRLWFPTIKGLSYVDPWELTQNTNPPPVHIESVWLDQELVAHTAGPVTVKPSDERVEISYTSLNLSAPERALFRYRMEGHEETWIEAGNSRVARYSRLPPGNYTFRVIACNEDGAWNEAGSRLAFIVQPPIWRTWWFITAMTLMVIGAVAGSVHLVSKQRYERELAVLRQQEALEKERARIARDIHDQVGASLTQLALLGELVESDKESPPDVEDHAKQISQTARETTRALDEIVWTVNPSNDTLEGLVNYICKYAQDYLGVAGIRYRLDVPAELPQWMVPTDVRHNVFLAAKEAITNVVRHAQASSAWIRVRLEGANLIVEIEDNGRGPGGMDHERAKTRHGLSNMRNRLEETGGQFTFTSGTEGGALVRLTVPLKPQKVG